MGEIGEIGEMGRMGGMGGMGEIGEMGRIVRSNDFSRCSAVMATAITAAILGSTTYLLGNWSQSLTWGRYLADAK